MWVSFNFTSSLLYSTLAYNEHKKTYKLQKGDLYGFFKKTDNKLRFRITSH